MVLQNKIIKKIIGYTIPILIALPFSSCRKFVEVDPPQTVLSTQTVFTNDASATSSLIGIYSKMVESNGFASIYTTLLNGLAADEFVNYSSNAAQAEFYTNSLNSLNTLNNTVWGNAYQYIYAANKVIEGITSSEKISEQVKRQLTGEAKFIRAFCYFYLVNMYGDVPLISSIDYKANLIASRTPKEEVYQYIITELKDAQTLLADGYVKNDNASTIERARPNRWAATALLARVDLYTEDWSNAEAQATSIINNTSKYSIVPNLDNVFLKNSTEAIWQLMSGRVDVHTWEANIFILAAAPCCATGSALSNQLLTAFDSADARKKNWINSFSTGGNTYYHPFKYKVKGATGIPVTEYYMVLRLAEQYLIRAEAKAQQNNLSGAIEDVNITRTRAELSKLSSSLSKTQILRAIEQERRFELFAEWGHRWFDLKNEVLGPLKAPNWQNTDLFYPIPQTEINNDNNLTQNPGY
jgi:starch-binding outer membrane protein, SusD/RagB family